MAIPLGIVETNLKNTQHLIVSRTFGGLSVLKRNFTSSVVTRMLKNWLKVNSSQKQNKNIHNRQLVQKPIQFLKGQ